MEQEAISNFEGKRVDLRYKNGFFLKGIIIKVYNESILFRTDQRDSIINLDEISSVVGGV